MRRQVVLTRGALQERGEVDEVAGAPKETSRSALGPGEGSRLCGPQLLRLLELRLGWGTSGPQPSGIGPMPCARSGAIP